MNITSELHEEVGIQKRKIIDRTEVQTVQSITDATIVGQFRRGVLGEMIIHQGNIRGELGYDPTNPDYIAVQSCLDAGIPSVKVIRIGGGGISCSGATDEVWLLPDSDNQHIMDLDIEINGVLFKNNGSQSIENLTGELLFASTHSGTEFQRYTSIYLSEDAVLNGAKLTHARVRLIPTSNYSSELIIHPNNTNPTVSVDPATGILSFCIIANTDSGSVE
ncbi:hypothetical protein [Acinetobacter chinensis]|uniref:hypothetical protein n=1 Tax=Acinetobacter chinensis TaxID=2004650 RepID=UPI002934620A|nr:hypothetical protein [Acinetobacter chinensis]WOE40052.1 hypothetical protein QSG87_09010 [Acinetobacter chinensis]